MSASQNIVLTVNAPVAATSVNLIGSTGGAVTVTGPLAAGAVVGVVLVQPSNWVGTLSLSGPDAALFTLSPSHQIVVGPAGLAPGIYNATAIATP